MNEIYVYTQLPQFFKYIIQPGCYIGCYFEIQMISKPVDILNTVKHIVRNHVKDKKTQSSSTICDINPRVKLLRVYDRD